MQEDKLKETEELNHIFETQCSMIADILKKKNADYGNAFSELYNQYGMVYPIMHLKEKINRFENLSLSEKDPNVVGESMIDSLKDLAGYAILTLSNLVLMDMKQAVNTERLIRYYGDELTIGDYEKLTVDEKEKIYSNSVLKLSCVEEMRYEKFREEHKDCVSNVDNSFSLIVTPTGIGNAVHCRCNKCGKEVNITDYETW